MSNPGSTGVALPDVLTATDARYDPRYVHQDGTGLPPAAVESITDPRYVPKGGTTGQMAIVRSDGTIVWTDPPVISAKAWGVDPTATASANAANGQAAIDAAAGNATVKFPAGILMHSSPFAIPANATGLDVGGAGRGTTVFQPTAAAVRVFDFPHIADGGTYSNTSLHDFSIDGSQLTLPAANQSIVGNLVNGGRGNRVNFSNIDIRRITVTGVPLATAAGGGSYQTFSFGSMQGGTTVAAGSTGVDVTTFTGAGVLNAVTTTGFPTSGQLKVQTSAGYAILSYTGVAGTTFTGVALVSGSGTLLTGYLLMEGTQNTLTGFTWEDLTVLGANNGFAIISDRLSGTANVGTNHYIDEIHWNRLYHDCGGTRVSGDKGGGGQIGGSAQGGTYRVSNCTFKNAGDTYEFDGMQSLVVTNTVVEDCVNGIFANNFNTPLNPHSQTVLFDKVQIRIVKLQPAAGFGAAGIQLGPASNQYTGYNTLGSATLRDCTFVCYAPNAPNTGMFIGASGRYVSNVTIENAVASHENMADTSTGGQQARYMAIAPLSSCTLTIRGLKFSINGTTTNATLAVQPVYIGTWSTSSGVALVVDIDNPQFSFNIPGLGSGEATMITFGVINGGTTTATYQGVISRFKFLPSTGDNSAKGIALTLASNFPINTTLGAALEIRDCDFSRGRSGGFDIWYGGGPDKTGNQPRVFLHNNRWGTNGPQSGVGRNTANAYFVNTAFTTGVGNQYVGGFSATAYISGGAGVTAVDVSRNNGTNYENLLTQAAAAIPATVVARLDNTDYLRLTFTTTAPTVVIIPDK